MFQVQHRRLQHMETQAAVNVSEVMEQKSRRDERSKDASDSSKLLLEQSRRQEEKFREEAEKRRREREEMQKKQLLELKQAENELMKRAQALRKESSSSDSQGSETDTRWKKGFFATLFGRKQELNFRIQDHTYYFRLNKKARKKEQEDKWTRV